VSDAPVDTRELRNAFGCFATGITVVTCLDGNGSAVGITANSFTSLSLDPPLMLWCLDRRSQTFEAFNAANSFVLTVLDTNGAAVASRFAMKGGHSAEDVESLVPTEMGPPTFADALAVFECDIHARHDGGDHVIMVGRVRRFTHLVDPERKGPGPLLYYRGRYGHITALTG
jgi:flavin reductase (DIM6/NTAB) family NADH-FMN oxidoreductase RutF